MLAFPAFPFELDLDDDALERTTGNDSLDEPTETCVDERYVTLTLDSPRSGFSAAGFAPLGALVDSHEDAAIREDTPGASMRSHSSFGRWRRLFE